MKFRNSITINDALDWELVASDVLDSFLEDFPVRKGLTRKPDSEDLYDIDGAISFMYTQKGMQLYDRMVNRLNVLGNKLFPDATFHYSPSNIIFP